MIRAKCHDPRAGPLADPALDSAVAATAVPGMALDGDWIGRQIAPRRRLPRRTAAQARTSARTARPM